MPDAVHHDLVDEYRPQFPIFESATYLNSCSLGALARRVRAALEEYAELWSRWGAAAWYEQWMGASADARSNFARLIGVGSEEIALAPSISAALSAVASAIDFGERRRVVTTELDFPTVVYQFLAKRPLGVETVVIPSPDGATVPIEAFADAIDERTALVATSHVFFTTGAIQDVKAIAELAHANGALCLIDAYQSTGQVPVDAREFDADVLVSGPLKWLLGGPGLAFLYVRRSLIAGLEPTIVSWFGVEDQFSFDPGEFKLRGDARRFELGTPAVPTIYAARAGLEMINEIGVRRIRDRVSGLTEDLIDRARAAGLTVRAADRTERRSGIVMVEHPEPDAAVGRMLAEGVIADYRAGAVRFSPHFYNTTEDNERAIGILSS